MYVRKLLMALLSFSAFQPVLAWQSAGVGQAIVAREDVAASQTADTVYVFRFVSRKDMFYIPWQGNGTRLEHLLSLVEAHKSDILSGDAPLLVDGYCASEPTASENLQLAKARSNRVKSELILSKGINEGCFITHNHAGAYGDLRHVVIVRLRLPKAEVQVKRRYGMKEEPAKEGPSSNETSMALPDTSKLERNAPEQVAAAETTPLNVPLTSTVPHSPYHLALRANLLRWATLTPDLGIEWRLNRRLGISVSGSWTFWSWDARKRRYALWKVSPEIRCYLGENARGFLGAMYHTGEFHYKLGKTGCQGDYRGGGLTGGYLLALNGLLSLDFHAGAGYTYADYDKYALINNVRVRKDSKGKNYWGINQLGITLIWRVY